VMMIRIDGCVFMRRSEVCFYFHTLLSHSAGPLIPNPSHQIAVRNFKKSAITHSYF
jgi:hypothetical protein